MIKSCVRSSVPLSRSYGIASTIHLFNGNNGNNGINNNNNNSINETINSKIDFKPRRYLSQSFQTPASSLILSNNCIKRYYSKSHKPSKKIHDKYLESDSDSDSEHEYKPKQRGNTEFWRRKMRTLHSLLDVNNDGVISFDDFQLLANKFTALGHLTPEAQEEFMNVLKKTWEEQWGEITPYNLVNAEQYLTEMHHAVNDRELRSKIHYFLPYLFKAVDKDHSGFITLHEFKLFFKCLGLTPEQAAVSFAMIDSNGDGKLSIKEFVKLGREFFLTENEKKASRMFWGPLCNY